MNQREIENIAFIKHVSKSPIDKDWILGHILNAFYSGNLQGLKKKEKILPCQT